MSFGFGAGDIINVSTLAWKLFKSCKDAPGEFKNVAGEVVSLHVVLKETEELVAESNLSSHQTTQLQHLTDGCQSVLHDLTRLLKKYQSLGSKSQKTWDRLKWGSEGIANARTRLISNTTMLSAYNTTMVKYVSSARGEPRSTPCIADKMFITQFIGDQNRASIKPVHGRSPER